MSTGTHHSRGFHLGFVRWLPLGSLSGSLLVSSLITKLLNGGSIDQLQLDRTDCLCGLSYHRGKSWSV